MQSIHHTTDINIKYNILSQTNSTLLTADMISFCIKSHIQKCSSTFPFLNKKHKLHEVHCQVVYVTFDISVTKKKNVV